MSVMMLQGDRHTIPKWVGEHTLPPEQSIQCIYTSLAFLQDLKLTAGIVYHNYESTGDLMELSGYATGRHWTTPETVDFIFGWPFRTINLRILYGRTKGSNPVRRLWKKLGAMEIVCPGMHHTGEDMVITRLHRDDWAKSKFNLQRTD